MITLLRMHNNARNLMMRIDDDNIVEDAQQCKDSVKQHEDWEGYLEMMMD